MELVLLFKIFSEYALLITILIQQSQRNLFTFREKYYIGFVK